MAASYETRNRQCCTLRIHSRAVLRTPLLEEYWFRLIQCGGHREVPRSKSPSKSKLLLLLGMTKICRPPLKVICLECTCTFFCFKAASSLHLKVEKAEAMKV